MAKYNYEKYSIIMVWSAETKSDLSSVSEISSGYFYQTLNYSDSSGYSFSGGTISVTGLTNGGEYYSGVSNGSNVRYANGIKVYNSYSGGKLKVQYFYKSRTGNQTKGTLKEIVTEKEGVYPTDGIHTDGFWYVQKERVPINKYLFQDGDKIKSILNGILIDVGQLPVTIEMFANYGIDEIGEKKTINIKEFGTMNPDILYWTDVSPTRKKIDVVYLPSWKTISTTLPSVDTFKSEGMNDLSVFDRKSTEFVIPMDDNGLSGSVLGSGRVFKEKVDLKKLFEINSLNVK
jgi:hypothetical protein